MMLQTGAVDSSAYDPRLARSNASSTARSLELRALAWDTNFFGSRMGVIVPTGAAPVGAPERPARLVLDLHTVLAEARTAGFAHLILRVPADDLALGQVAETAGLTLVDVATDSQVALERVPPRLTAEWHTVRPARPADLPALTRLAEGSFALSRFAADAFFSLEQAAAFYRQWMTNLFHGLARTVLVSDLGGEVAGFVACSLSEDHGRISLIATQPGTRRRGVGRGLVNAALHWFQAEGARVVSVKTQSANYPALALYQRCGFIVSSSELTFSITLHSADASVADRPGKDL
jgi:dTDP-4-amino-4,6-dideoxy-D-galactose acyltransferase